MRDQIDLTGFSVTRVDSGFVNQSRANELSFYGNLSGL